MTQVRLRHVHRARARFAGFTAVEVLIAMTILVIGAAGVMTMQKTSVEADLDARRMDVANSLARTWIERLQMDAATWTEPNATTTASNLANTTILNSVVNNSGAWFLPTQFYSSAGLSCAFDILGRDVPQSGGVPPFFCTEVRLTSMDTQSSGDPTKDPPSLAGAFLIRADVRVYWPRGITTSLAPSGFCQNVSSQQYGPDPTVYGSVYATTAIRENP